MKNSTPRPATGNSLGSLIVLSLLLGGCVTTKQTQLERVAKDWCMTIRASQILPVYPLTEDLQPGDLFLVQVPIDQQQQVYKEKGFLPFDNHIARLNPSSYTNFYANSFLHSVTNAVLPHDWLRPGATNTPPWSPAPHAAFPSYSFSVRRGGGLNLAVPIQGVPVGLSLLGSDAAFGSVSIRNAATLGVDIVSLHSQVTNWANANAAFLEAYAPSPKGTNFLRIISRVYAAGEMDVELRDASSRSAGLDVGAAKPVNLLFPDLATNSSNVTATVVTNFANGWNALTNILNAASSATGSLLPGGSLRLTGASARTVSLRETLNPPLLLGYLGFDCEILARGRLAPPIPTHAHLDAKARLHQAKVQTFNDELHAQTNHYHAIVAVYQQSTDADRRRIRVMARRIGLMTDSGAGDWEAALNLRINGNEPARTALFEKLNAFTTTLKH